MRVLVYRHTLLLSIIVLKVVLSIYSVWNREFIYLINTFFALKDKIHPIPYLWLTRIVYLVWSSVPFERVNLSSWLVSSNDFPLSFSSATLIFFLKLPILASSLLIGLLVYKHVSGRKRWLALLAWLLNPVVILNGEMAGNYDMVVAVLIFSSILLLSKQRYFLSLTPFAISVALKLYPIILLPVYLLCRGRGRKGIVALGLASFSGVGFYVYWASYYAKDIMRSFTLPPGNPFVWVPSEILLTPYWLAGCIEGLARYPPDLHCLLRMESKLYTICATAYDG
jgi:hypothetical protein